MATQVKCIINNETDYPLVPTLESDTVLNFGHDPGTTIEGETPPHPIDAKGTGNFTTSVAAGSTTGPGGWICYEFVSLRIVIQIIWADTSTGKNGFTIVENALDGTNHQLIDVPVKFTGPDGKDMSFDDAKTATSFTATFTVRVQIGAAVEPTQGTGVTDPVAGAPAGSGQIAMPDRIRTWKELNASKRDDAQKRKRILAVIGNVFPLAYWTTTETRAKTGPDDTGGSDVDAKGNLPGASKEASFTKAPLGLRSLPDGAGNYKQMTCWSPGPLNGTSCTGVNGVVGAAMGYSSSKLLWAFGAFNWKEAWVPWGSDSARKMPNVGDIYILYRDIVAKEKIEKGDSATVWPHERHCGYIVQVPNDTSTNWVTADGGQSDGTMPKGSPAHWADGKGRQVAFLNSRPWALRRPGEDETTLGKALKLETAQRIWKNQMVGHKFAKPLVETEGDNKGKPIQYPYLGGGAESGGGLDDANRLIGWVDMTKVGVKTDAFDPPGATRGLAGKYTQADYDFLCAWIDNVFAGKP